jgi:sugar (pentulose or hexulose) kinase
MSLIGIDLGTSAIKVVAYATNGTMLAQAARAVPGYRPEPGHWEVDVFESLAAFKAALTAVTADMRVKNDPPVAVSFSSSGREVFPVSDDGTPLGVCLMTPDIRGDDIAAETAARRSPEDWFRLTGHVPRRMDPINRALWWRRTNPAVASKAHWFMNWHEFYSLLLTGRPIVDWSDAGTWATYDVATGNWSAERVTETGIDPGWLPEVQPNGTPIGTILPGAAKEFDLPLNTLVVTGAYDIYAASVGSGAVDPGAIALACGMWHSYTVPVLPGWPGELVHDGFNVFPHPGPTGFGVLATDPNGMSVVDWFRDLVHLSIPDLEAGLEEADPGPGHVFADAAFTPLPHVSAMPGFGGTFSGVTLASTRIDIIRALLESIACNFSISLERLRNRGVETKVIRATGGGSRNAWWLQMMADVCEIPIEVVAQNEPGTFGAAILAGVGAGVYGSVSDAVAELVQVGRRFEPDLQRGALYADVRSRLEAAGEGARQ